MLRHRRTNRIPRGRVLMSEFLESRHLLAGDVFQINFQLAGAPTPARYLADTGEPFGIRDGGLSYGWSSDHTDVSRDRGVDADQRLDTLIHFHQGQTWEMALSNGTYEVTVAIGDPQHVSTHTLNVEGVSYWTAVPLSPGDFRFRTEQITVSDGRLTLDQGTAGEKATRIDYIQIVGLPASPNASPSTPVVLEPEADGQQVNPADVHLEAIGFADADGDSHRSSDWEIWAAAPSTSIYSNVGDGFVEVRSTGGSWPQVHPDTEGGSFANTGAWLGNDGLTSTVLPFQLPDLGIVSNPFRAATFGVRLSGKGAETVTNVDLYGIRVNASPDIVASDFYAGSLEDPNATLIQRDFMTPSSAVATASAPNQFTDSDGDARLVAFLNAAYADGTNVGKYVFVRLSYASSAFAKGSDAYTITTSESAGGIGDYPVISYVTEFTERVWQTLGITGVERLHTHLADGHFENGLAGRTELAGERDYELRVRFRDTAGSVSDYATRTFQTAAASQVLALEIEDILSAPPPRWVDARGNLSLIHI